MNVITINVSSDFSPYPGVRYRKQGSFSGEEFREEILEPRFKQALKEEKILVIELDNTEGYGSSFLEEVFGQMARTYGKKVIREKIQLKSNNEFLLEEIGYYIENVEKK